MECELFDFCIGNFAPLHPHEKGPGGQSIAMSDSCLACMQLRD